MSEEGRKRRGETKLQRADRLDGVTEIAKQILRAEVEAREAKTRRLRASRQAQEQQGAGSLSQEGDGRGA